jgi:putative tryptophan/tyrosine transport system substrate-binding protein
MIGRRAVLAAFAGAAAYPAHSARAQQPRMVGVLMSLPENDPEAARWIAVMRQELARLGWREGENLRIEVRFAGGDAARGRTNAAELVAGRPDALLAHGSPMLLAALGATRTLPIVGVSFGDPVGSGPAATLARPGGNVTGFANFEHDIAAKWLEMLIALAPGVGRALFLHNPRGIAGHGLRQVLEAAAPGTGVRLVAAPYADLGDIETALAAFAPGGGGLIVQPDFVTTTHRGAIVGLALHYRLPAVYPFRFLAEAGGLASYGVDTAALYRPAAGYLDRILRGENAGDLPIQLPTRYEFVLNLKTAKDLGLMIPPSLLARADEVIE